MLELYFHDFMQFAEEIDWTSAYYSSCILRNKLQVMTARTFPIYPISQWNQLNSGSIKSALDRS